MFARRELLRSTCFKVCAFPSTMRFSMPRIGVGLALRTTSRHALHTRALVKSESWSSKDAMFGRRVLKLVYESYFAISAPPFAKTNPYLGASSVGLINLADSAQLEIVV